MSDAHPGSRAATALVAIVFVVIWGLITHGTFAGSGDDPHYLMIARSIAFDGDFDLSNDYADPASLVGAGTLTPGLHVRPGIDGTLRPVHDVGLPLLAAPLIRVTYPLAVWLGGTLPPPWLEKARLNASLIHRHFLSLAMAIVAGFLAVELRRLLLRVGLAPRAAFWWALLGTLSPPILSHAFLFMTEVPTALIVLIVLRRVFDGPTSTRAAIVTGLLIGLLGLIHVRNGPIALALAGLALHRLVPWKRDALHQSRSAAPGWQGARSEHSGAIRATSNAASRDAPPANDVTHHVFRGRGRQWAPIMALVTGILAIVMVRTAIHLRFWGTPFFDAHARLGAPVTAVEGLRQIGERLTGLFMDQEFGLLAFAPVYLLAFPGLVRLYQRDRAIARALLLVLGCYVGALILPWIDPYDWVGGWSPAARFLVPIAPLLLAAAAIAADDLRGWRRNAMMVLVVVQVGLDAIVWNAPKLLWDLADGHSSLIRALPALDTLFTYLPAWHGEAASPWPFALAAGGWLVFAFWMLGGQRSADGAVTHT